MKKLVVLTGAGMSVESGLKTFRDAGGLWENYPVEDVATHEGLLRDPVLVNNFYNMMRHKSEGCMPNQGHKLLAEMENDYEVQIITQNVDNLHERAGSSNVIHLHGELMKVCSSENPYDERYIRELSTDNMDVQPGEKAGDGSLLRPFIVFFGESVPMIEPAARQASSADIFVVIGTSLNVYPAAGLLAYVPRKSPIYLIDPNPGDIHTTAHVTIIKKGASEGVAELINMLKNS